MDSAPPSGDDPFLRRLAERCVPAPAEVAAIDQSKANPTTNELLVAFGRQALAALLGTHPVREPSSSSRARKTSDLAPSLAPVLQGAGKLLWRWVRPWLGLGLALLAYRCSSRAFATLAAVVLSGCASDWQLCRSLLSPGPTKPGVHFADTERNRRILAHFQGAEVMRSLRMLTPYLWNGDLRTLVPFVLFGSQRVPYHRLWFESWDDDDADDTYDDNNGRGKGKWSGGGDGSACASRETLALDILLPPGGFDHRKPVAVVLHGLNGGSSEAYVADFVLHAARQRGWAVAVMNGRGLGGTPIRNGRLFHGARTVDVARAVRIVRACADGAPVVGVGFSMGAIVLANFVGKSGERSGLDCAVAVSGCYDCVANMRFAYGRDMWQPWLTHQLKTNYLLREPQGTFVTTSGKVDVPRALSSEVRNILDFDAATVVPYEGFADLEDYYKRMSLGHGDKLRKVATPLLALHACDDPIVDSATFAEIIQRTTVRGSPDYNPNCWFFITRFGGHVGWGIGLRPVLRRWAFMHQAVEGFADAVLADAAEATTPMGR